MSPDDIESAIRIVEKHQKIDENERHTLRRIFKSISDLGIDLRLSSYSDLISFKNSLKTRSSNMDAQNSNSRGNSASPKQDASKPDSKQSKGKGKASVNNTTSNLIVNGTAGANGVPGPATWKGPEQDSAATVNGDPFNGHASKEIAGLRAAGQQLKSNSPMALLNQDSTADEARLLPPILSGGFSKSASKVDKGKAKVTQHPQQPIGTRGSKFNPGYAPSFTTDVGPDAKVPGGHYIKINNAVARDADWVLERIYEKYGWESKVRGTHTMQPTDNSKFLSLFYAFDDMRDAGEALSQVEIVSSDLISKLDSKLTAQYVCQTEFATTQKEAKNGVKTSTSFHDGLVLFTARFQGPNTEFSLEGLADKVHAFAMSQGEVLAFTTVDHEVQECQFYAKYYKISTAKAVVQAVSEANPKHIGKWAIVAKELPDYTVQAVPRTNGGPVQFNGDGLVTPHKGHFGVVNAPNQAVSSPTGRTAWCFDENGNPVPTRAPNKLPKWRVGSESNTLTPQARHQSEPVPQAPTCYVLDNGPRSNTWPGPDCTTPRYIPHGILDVTAAPQCVDIAKIQEGIDVRTTIMLRNLPNSMNCHKLKDILDESSFGKYDFSYLRVDFGNNLNVGYGFVNFTDPVHIIDFANTWVGRVWDPSAPFNPDNGPRVGEISYATVQGRDCLEEKFRNSAVMDEFKDFRPKLWYSENSAPNESMIGVEQAFPGPNNWSKHQRSRDNASQIGLYASGNRRNKNQRGNRQRHSQYDRGTSAQIREDAYYNQAWDQMSPVSHGYGDSNYMLTGASSMVMTPPMQTYPAVMYGVPNTYHGPMPYYNNGSPMMMQGYGTVPTFTNPWNNSGYVPAPQSAGPPRRGRFSRLARGQPNVRVHPGRDEETARQAAIEGLARDRADYEAEMFQIRAARNAEAHGSTSGVQDGANAEPRPMTAERAYVSSYGGGQYAPVHYVNGQIANGTYANGTFVNGQPVSGNVDSTVYYEY